MNLKRRAALSAILCLVTSSLLAQSIVTGGVMFVSLDATNLVSLPAGATITNWPNSGTTPAFHAVNTTNGPVFQFRGSIPVARFNGTANACMTNGPFGSVPGGILSNNSWTVEAWVFRPLVTGTQTFFSWTPRANLANNTSTVLEMRYSADANNAVEHYGSTENLTWGGPNPTTLTWPASNEWHHIVCTRESNTRERLYVDGRMVTEAMRPALNLYPDGAFTLGGVWQRDSSSWGMLFNGDIAQVRVHDDPLTPEDVLNNYRADNARYNRAVAHDADWTGAWQYSVAAANNKGLWIRGGAPLELSSSLSVPHLRPDNGGLVVTNSATLSIAAMNGDITFGAMAGNAFDLQIPSGTLTMPAYATNTAILAFGGYGASATVSVGGGATPAQLVYGGTIRFGNYTGTTSVAVQNSGTVTAVKWIRAGDNSSYATLSVAAGGTMNALDTFIAGPLSGTGIVSVAGTLNVTNAVNLGENNGGYGQLTIASGGLVTAQMVKRYNTNAVGRLIFDGGTLRANANVSPFAYSLSEIRVTANGATVNIPTNVATLIPDAILEDPSSAGGGFTKTGAGELTLSGDCTFTGNVTVLDGTLIFRSNAIPVTYTGRILVTNNAAIGYDLTGGAARILSHLETNSVGRLLIFGNNAAENLDLSNYPGITLQARGTITQTGTVTPFDNHYFFAPISAYTYSPVIADIPGHPARVTVRGADGTYLILTGDNNPLTGGISVESGGLSLAHVNAAGTTSAKDLYLGTNATLKLAAAFPADFVATRVTDDSRPTQIFITPESAACDLDLTRFPGCFAGTDSTNVIYAGTLAPDGSTYLLGGGKTVWTSSPNNGLILSNLVDMVDTTPRQAVLGREGLVRLSTGNTYSGGTLVTNKAALFLASDGLGSVPTLPDPDNLSINNGILRIGNANFSLPATRGMAIGPLGAEIHPWGTYTMTLLGDLSGNGPIRITDQGGITAAGAQNTYNGLITLANTLATLGIGNGSAFSWASVGGITNNANLVLNNNQPATFADTVYGNGKLYKRGSGQLTVTKAHPFTGRTYLQEGSLCFSGNGSLGNGTLVNSGELLFSNNAVTVLSQAIGTNYSGSGSVRVTGSGSGLLLDSDYNFAGGFIAETGTAVSAARPGAFGTNGITLADSTLTLAASGAMSATGFGTDWKLNMTGGVTALVPTNGTTWLQLTQNIVNSAGSAFFTNRVQATGAWRAEFDYYTGAKTSVPADGFAFVLHNDARATNALGATGGSLGLSGINNSFGFYINIYNNDGIGWALNGNKLAITTNIFSTANGLEGGNVHFALTYDCKTLTLVASQAGKTYAASYATNLVAVLGGTTAWVGLTGGTGGSTCQQLIGNFTYSTGSFVPLLPLGTNNWQLNGSTALTNIGSKTVLRVTSNVTSQAGSCFQKQKVNITQPFTLTCRYWVSEYKSSNPADGVALFFQNSSLTSIGGSGGSLGYLGITPSLGWALDIYSNPKEALVWLYSGVRSNRFEVLDANGITLDSGAPVDVSLSYDLRRLRISVTQSGHTVTAEPPADVNLFDYFGTPYVYFGVSGGTGGQTAEQFVSDLTLTSGLGVTGGAAYSNTVTAVANTHSTLAVAARADAADLSIAALTLESGAGVMVGAAAGSPANTAYSLTINGLQVNGPGTALSVTNNGTGTGLIKLGGAVTFAAGANLTLKGTFDAAGKIQVVVPDLGGGIHPLADLTQSTGLTLDDFELVTPMKGSVLRLNNGILYVLKATGSVLHLK